MSDTRSPSSSSSPKRASFILAIVAALAGAVAGLASRFAAGDLRVSDGVELGSEGIACVSDLTRFVEARNRKVGKATLSSFCAAIVAAPEVR